MLLTAHRVRSPSGVTGINLFVYRHAGDLAGDDLAALERSAVLERKDLEVPPGSNAVTSYLDVFAPESARAPDIARAVAAFLDSPNPPAFPAVFDLAGVTCRLGLVFGLVPSWRHELTELASRLLFSAERAR